jgi:hypothetical protein
MFVIYLFRGEATIDGISVRKVIGKCNSKRFPFEFVNGTDERGFVHEILKVGHHFIAGLGITVFVIVP